MDYNIINPAMYSIQEIYATLLALNRIRAIDGFNCELTIEGVIDITIYENSFERRVNFKLEPIDTNETVRKKLIDYLHKKYDDAKEDIEQKISLLHYELSMYKFLKQKYNG